MAKKENFWICEKTNKQKPKWNLFTAKNQSFQNSYKKFFTHTSSTPASFRVRVCVYVKKPLFHLPLTEPIAYHLPAQKFLIQHSTQKERWKSSNGCKTFVLGLREKVLLKKVDENLKKRNEKISQWISLIIAVGICVNELDGPRGFLIAIGESGILINVMSNNRKSTITDNGFLVKECV